MTEVHPVSVLTVSQADDLARIHRNFNTLIKSIKSDLPWTTQQEYEWSLPSYKMFEALLRSCIQDK